MEQNAIVGDVVGVCSVLNNALVRTWCEWKYVIAGNQICGGQVIRLFPVKECLMIQYRNFGKTLGSTVDHRSK